MTPSPWVRRERAADGIPPPRLTDTVSSEVTVPNGYAVVVGL